jgi:hypothetical protein
MTEQGSNLPMLSSGCIQWTDYCWGTYPGNSSEGCRDTAPVCSGLLDISILYLLEKTR